MRVDLRPLISCNNAPGRVFDFGEAKNKVESDQAHGTDTISTMLALQL